MDREMSGEDHIFLGMALHMAAEAKSRGKMADHARLLILATYIRIMAITCPTGTIDLDNPLNPVLPPEDFEQVETWLLDAAAACRNARMQLIFEKEKHHDS